MKILIFTFAMISSLAVLAAPKPIAIGPQKDFYNDLENFQKSSLSLKTEKAKLEAAEDYKTSKSLFWTPTVSIGAGKTKTTLNGTTTSDQDYWQATASVNLFKGGSDWATMNQANEREKAQQLSFLNEEMNLEINASSLIFKTIYLKESVRVQEELLHLKEESIKIIKERYNQGKTPLQEVTKSEVDLSQQKNKVRDSGLKVLENEMQIKGLFVDFVKTEIWPFSEDAQFTFLDEKKLPTEKLPSVEMKYWTAKSYQSALKSAKRSYWPSLDFSLQYQESPLSARDQKQVTSLLQISLPLWSRYETAASISSAHANSLAADEDFQSSQRVTSLKRQYFQQKINVSRQNLKEAKLNLDKAKKLYSDLLRSYRLGRLSTNDLLIEQNRLLETESNLADSQISYHQTVVESCALQGLHLAECLK